MMARRPRKGILVSDARRDGYVDHTLSCWHKKRDVVIRINVNGLAVCKEWKKCMDQGSIGCPEQWTRDNIQNLIRKHKGLPERMTLQRMVIDAFKKLKGKLGGG